MCTSKAAFRIQGSGAAGRCSTLKRDLIDIEARQKIQAQKC
jgi:hypothetical protein